MSSTELWRWARRFGILRAELLTQASAPGVEAPDAREHLVAVQLSAFREFTDTPPWAPMPELPPPITDAGAARGAEHLLLACHYLLALPSTVAASADAASARIALADLLARLQDLASLWAERGVEEERARAIAAANHRLHHAATVEIG